MNSFEKSMTEEFLSLESFIIIKKGKWCHNYRLPDTG
jgi:hypothetical protein